MPMAIKLSVAMISSDFRLDAGCLSLLMYVSLGSVCRRCCAITATQCRGKLRIQRECAGSQVSVQKRLLLNFVLCQQHLYEVAQAGLVPVYRNLVSRLDGFQACCLVYGLLLERLDASSGIGNFANRRQQRLVVICNGYIAFCLPRVQLGAERAAIENRQGDSRA